MLLEEIKKANITALKERDTLARSFYSVLTGKIKLEEINKREKGETVDDVAICQIIQKMVKELAEEKENYIKANNSNEANIIDKQIQIAKSYLPTMLSRDEIKVEILKLSDKTIPSIMKHFKTNFAGKCDMRDVSEVAKQI